MSGSIRPDISNKQLPVLKNLQDKVAHADVSEAPAIFQELGKINVGENLFNSIKAIPTDGSAPADAASPNGDVASTLVELAHTLKALVQEGSEQVVETAKSLKSYLLNTSEDSGEPVDESSKNDESAKNAAAGQAESRKNAAQGRAEEAKNRGQNQEQGVSSEDDGAGRPGKGHGRNKAKGDHRPGWMRIALGEIGSDNARAKNPHVLAFLQEQQANQPEVPPADVSTETPELTQSAPAIAPDDTQAMVDRIQAILNSQPPLEAPQPTEPPVPVVSEPVEPKPAEAAPVASEPAPVTSEPVLAGPEPLPPTSGELPGASDSGPVEPAPAPSEPAPAPAEPLPVNNDILAALPPLDLSSSESVSNFMKEIGSMFNLDPSVVNFATDATLQQAQTPDPLV